MRLRWSTYAADDLYSITRYVSLDKPAAARQVARTFYDGCESLATSPYRGRKGKEQGTRELVLSPLPYIAIYRVHHDVVEILRIWHGAQDR